MVVVTGMIVKYVKLRGPFHGAIVLGTKVYIRGIVRLRPWLSSNGL